MEILNAAQHQQSAKPAPRDPLDTGSRGWDPPSWIILLIALAVHALLLALLPAPRASAAPGHPLIIVQLNSPPPTPPAVDETKLPTILPAEQTAQPTLPFRGNKAAAAGSPIPESSAAPTAVSTLPLSAPGSSGPVVESGTNGGTAAGPGVPAGSGGSGSGSSSGPAGSGSGTGTAPLQPPAEPVKPAPATPPPPKELEVDVKALLSEYASGVKATILRHKSYPQLAERLGHEGAVKVSFSIGADGGLNSVSVRDSSGYDELDEAALDAVRAAAPFDPLPEAAGRDELALSLTLRFNLN